MSVGFDPLKALKTVCHWLLNDGVLVKKRSANATKLGHPAPRMTSSIERGRWRSAGRRRKRRASFNPAEID